ncbi:MULTISPECIES: hypothetical protein [Pseudomonas]|uniref:hypothetical protein n=1 Tax=Pseudomonas TaxID=286 RepID=UPI000F01852E|nr:MULTISPECIES: hypothetical protein [Pseudomonas]MBD8615120.1 hypothetical protein [Pseudomonas putida]MBD8681205.1 hypothetical protein [Pseudomonas sp. CFBP 13719]
MTSNEPLNLPLDFGVPDEVVFAAAVEMKDYETLGKLYEQGMPMNDPDFALQDFLLDLEDGLELSDAAINGFALRIYKTLALTDLEDDPLSQNAIYQLLRNVMADDLGVMDSSARLAASLMKLPYTKSDKHSVLGTMLEAAVDILDETDSALDDTLCFARRFKEVYPGTAGANAFAAHSCVRHFGSDSVNVNSTIGLTGILTHPSPETSEIKDAFCRHLKETNPGRVALLVVLQGIEKSSGNDRATVKHTLEGMARDGFEMSRLANAVEDDNEMQTLLKKLDFDRSLFKPQMMKPHMRDSLIGVDLGL